MAQLALTSQLGARIKVLVIESKECEGSQGTFESWIVPESKLIEIESCLNVKVLAIDSKNR